MAGVHSPSDINEQVKTLRSQNAVLAEFGKRALRTHDLGKVLGEATALISEMLQIELVKVLELLPDRRRMLVRAGVNWHPGVVGHAVLDADANSPAGYALQCNAPVICRDIASETRFAIPQLLFDHGVKSMVNVVIRGERGAFGVLEVDARDRCEFDEDDVAFLSNYANLIAAAIDRQATHDELERTARERDIFMRELQHRVKNILANVQALSTLTRSKSSSIGEFATAFEDRISALARTQDLLTRSASPSLPLRVIVQTELEAHGAEEDQHFSLHGPPLMVPPRMVQALGMVFHELSTNATKYGALAAEHGRIEMSWTVDGAGEQRHLQLRWRESGVRIENAMPKKGVGSDISRIACRSCSAEAPR
jgi:two-component sensor histidine kinase